MRSFVLFRTPLLSILLFWSYFNASAQIFSPEMENYSIEDYNADNQNWDIDVDENGVAFVANNKGLLRYNGQSWQLFELPQKTIIRSVLCTDDKIFMGSYEEFGFWEADNYGNYLYTSLTFLFDKNHEFTSEEFWQIVEFKDDIVFRSFGGIYIYDGKKISFIDNSEDTSSLVVYQDKVLVGSLNEDLRELEDGNLIPFILSGKQIEFTSVNNLVAFDNLLFLFDLNREGYIYDSKRLYPLPEKITSFLNNYNINKVVFKDRNTLIFGTIKNGIIVYGLKTKNVQLISKEIGLHNNTVLGLKFHDGNLWGTLDNGICRINFDSPYQYYYDPTGSLGSVYDVACFDNRYYLASNTGIYSFTDDNRLQLIKNSEGHVWNLSIINNSLFCGHNRGTFYTENNELIELDLNSGGVYIYTKVPSVDNTYLQGNYLGISLLTYKQNKWELRPIENLSFPVNNIVFESDFVIWATHPYKGIFRIELDKNYAKAKIQSYENNENLKQYKTDVFGIDNEIVFYNSNRWFQYFNYADSIGEFIKFENFQNKDLINKEANRNWFIERDNSKSLIYVNDNFEEVLQINAPEIKRRLVYEYEKIIIKNDSIRIINLNDGFAIFNIGNIKANEDYTANQLIIDKIYSKDKQYSIKDSVFNISFKDARNFSFEVYAPNLYQNDITYSLSGRTEQKDMLKNGKLTLQNLLFGDYSLSLQRVGFGDEAIVNKKISFNVLPPWYLSNLMRIVYLLLAISIIYSIFKINKIKIRKQQLALKKSFIKDTQKRINKMEKESLERDILSKKRELTTTTETIIKKNETIILLRNELNRLLDVSPNKPRTKNLISLSTSKKEVDYDWKVFESSFNELHEDFFKRLISQYPKLTTKDLKLCAYIKSGLISKEIAPLLGITTRGIEINRYRLRKKINIDSNDNISNFLMLF